MTVKIGYIRTSRSDQNTQNQRQLLEAEGIPPHLIFVDAGISGKIKADTRPGWSALQEHLNKTHVDAILVFEISRIGRSFVDTLQTVIDLEERDIKIWSLSPAESWMRIESAEIRKLILTIFAWAAERERTTLIERTHAGLERAKSEGKTLGRPYREIPMGKVKELRKKKISIAAISRQLDIPYNSLYRRVKKMEGGLQ